MKLKLGAFASDEDYLGLKDAVHVAVVVVKCEEYLTGGQSVRFKDDCYNVVVKCEGEDRHGIVDPFIQTTTPDSKFLIILIPGATANLRHNYDLVLTDVPEYDDGCKGCN